MLSLTIQKIIQETPDTITIVFHTAHLPFSYQAGQYITLLLEINRIPYYRSYSLATSPYTDSHPAITIKRVKNGIVSNYLNDHLTPGQTLSIIPPQGNFTLLPQPTAQRHLLFIAGGSGITPLYAMIKTALAQEPQSQLYLIYANRRPSDIIYHRSLHALLQTANGRLAITHILSAPPQEWKGLTGRLTPTLLSNLLDAKNFHASAHYFLCAPQGLHHLSLSTLIQRGVPKTHIHTESFTPPATSHPPQSPHAQVTILADGDTQEIQVPPGHMILDAAFAQDIYTIPSSCMNGICNTCRAKCLRGKVHMQTDEGLSQEEKKEGYILTCVAQPLTPQVLLQID